MAPATHPPLSTETAPDGGVQWGCPADDIRSATDWLTYGEGRPYPLISPVVGIHPGQAHLWSIAQMDERLRRLRENLEAGPVPEAIKSQCLADLRAYLARHRATFVQAMSLETGFIRRDCEEMVDGAIQFVDHLPVYVRDQAAPARTVPYTYPPDGRTLLLRRRPFGTVALIAPQNAFLMLSLVAGLSAWAAGNRVIIKVPTQSAWSAAYLHRALETAGFADTGPTLVLASAPDFLEAGFNRRIDLIHYIGGSRHAPTLLAACNRHGAHAIVDGEGNTIVAVGRSFPVHTAAELIAAGCTRYNGQTCTSINGVLAEPEVYDALRRALLDRLQAMTCGDPLDPGTDVGPVFTEAQAEETLQVVQTSGGRICCGGTHRGPLLSPTLVDAPGRDSALVREGLFGPAVWIAPVPGAEWRRWLDVNAYPLACGVLTHDDTEAERFVEASRYARVSVNADPSVESVFEPWGAYGGSGLNPPSPWPEKYQRVMQIDRPIA